MSQGNGIPNGHPNRHPDQAPQVQVAAAPPAAIIQIVMTQDGRISCNQQGCSRPVFLMMMETAKQDMHALLLQQESQTQQKVVAPPAIIIPGLRG